MADGTSERTKIGPIAYFTSAIDSSIGRKYIMALSGLGLVGFIVIHLLGNLTLLAPTSDAFNSYAHKLESLGPLLYFAEVILLFTFIFHIVFALKVTGQNKVARPDSYQHSGNAGAPSKKTVYSQTMIYTGLVLFGFLFVHVWMFKFGGMLFTDIGMTSLHGEQVRDLHAQVLNYFKNPAWVALYSGVIFMLGFHLRHAFWSAFQSLGLNHPRFMPLIQCAGVCISLLLAVGFLLIPIWMYVRSMMGVG